MRKFIWALMVAAAASMTLVACDPEENNPTEEPTPSEKCEVCGQDPCVCEEPGEVCPDCGKNPCECEPTPPAPSTPDWCDYYYTVETTCLPTTVYAFDSFQLDQIVDENGKTIHENLGYESWADLAKAIGTLDEAKVFDREVLYMGYDLGSENDLMDAYNTNYFGYWVNATGAKDAWGTETVRIFTEAEGFTDEESGNTYHSGKVNIGTTHVAGVMQVGDVYKCGIVIQKTSGETVTRAGVEVVVTVSEYQDPEAGKYPETPTAGTFDISFEETISLSALTYAYEGPSWTEEFELVKQKLGMTTYEFFNVGAPTLDDNGEVYTGMTKTYTLPDGTTGSGVNVWLNADSQVVAWGAADCVVCMEWVYGADYMSASACVFPGAEDGDFSSDAVDACVGKTFNVTYTITYIPDEDEDMIPDQDATVINMNFAITIAE